MRQQFIECFGGLLSQMEDADNQIIDYPTTVELKDF